MAITVKYLEDLGVEKDVAAKIFAERSKEIEADKAKKEKLETELKEKTENLENLTTEFETLKTANASGEDWKAKFEALQAENLAKEKQAEAERILAEKNASIDKRFEAALGDKKFNHDAIRADYRQKFGEAIELEENKSKSDADIFHDLTKDDASAFVGVTTVKLVGGKTLTGDNTNQNLGNLSMEDYITARKNM